MMNIITFQIMLLFDTYTQKLFEIDIIVLQYFLNLYKGLKNIKVYVFLWEIF